MGGAGAFAANIGAAVGVSSTFFSRDPLPTAIAERFAPGVHVATKDGTLATCSEHADASKVARTNMSAEYGVGADYGAMRVNGVDRRLITEGTGRVILGTHAKDVKPGFHGVEAEALRRLAADTDLFFFVGAHYLTQGSHDDAVTAARDLAGSLDVMKKANPSLLRHAQYVVPKNPDNEAVVWGELKGHVDSLALNSVEVAPFVDALYDGKLSKIDIDPHLPREAAEDTAHMLEGALALVDALNLARVHLHGLEGDLVVSKPGDAAAPPTPSGRSWRC